MMANSIPSQLELAELEREAPPYVCWRDQHGRKIKRRGGKRPGAGSKLKRSYDHLVSTVDGRLKVLGLSATKKNVRGVIEDIRIQVPTFYADVPNVDSLVTYYGRYRHRLAAIKARRSATARTTVARTDELAACGRWMFLLQKWGKSPDPGKTCGPEKAREMVNYLIAIAGPRLSYIARCFDRLEAKGVADWRKFRWVQREIREMTNDPERWPVIRERRDRGPDKIRGAVRAGFHTTSEIVRHAKMTSASVVTLTNDMVDFGELTRTAWGTFDLPGPGVKPYVRIARIIVETLAARSGLVETSALMTAIGVATGKSPPACIQMQLTNLVKNGIVIRHRGAAELSPAALEKIARNEVIRDGRGVLWELPAPERVSA